MSDDTSLDKWRQHCELTEALRRIEDVLRRSSLRKLSIDDLIEELFRFESDYPTAEVVERLVAARLTSTQRRRLRVRLDVVVEQYRAAPVKNSQNMGRAIARLMPKLAEGDALKLIRPLLDDPRKSRRELAYSVFRWAPIDKETARDLLAQYRESGELRLLKILVAAVGSAQVADLLPLLDDLEDRYWRMRVLQALLSADVYIPDEVVTKHPTEFLQAMARLKHRRSLPRARRLIERFDLRNDPNFVAWFAWSMFAIGQDDELNAVRRIYRRLQRRRLAAEKDNNWLKMSSS